MKDITIILKYRIRIFLNAIFSFNNIWLSLFLLIYIPFCLYTLYNSPSMIAGTKLSIANLYKGAGQDGNVMLSLNLFFLLLISFSCDTTYMFFLRRYYKEYSHLPIKPVTLNLVFFFEPIFLNILNYYIFIYIFSFASYLSISNRLSFIFTLLLLLAFKILMFLFTIDFIYILMNVIKKIGKIFFLNNLSYAFCVPIFFIGNIIFIFFAFDLKNNIDENSIYYHLYLHICNNLPTKLLVNVLFTFSKKQFVISFFDLLIIFIFIAIFYFLFQKYKPLFFDGKESYELMALSASSRHSSYKESSIYIALIKKDFNYFIVIPLFYTLLIASLFLLKSINAPLPLLLEMFFIYSMFTTIFLYSLDIKGLLFLKSLPLSLRRIYWIKFLFSIINYIFFIIIVYVVLYLSDDQKLKSLFYSCSFIIFISFNIWLNIYLADLFLFFIFREKSRYFFSKHTFFNLIILLFTIFITLYAFHFMECFCYNYSIDSWPIIFIFALFHASIHAITIKRFENNL